MSDVDTSLTIAKYAVPSVAAVGVAFASLQNKQMRNLAVTTAGMFIALGASDLLLKSGAVSERTAALIGGLPLTNVTYQEVAYSDKDLKYRATGNTFLAHQEGDRMDVAITLKGTLLGPKRFGIMGALEALHFYGKGKVANPTTLVDVGGIYKVINSLGVDVTGQKEEKNMHKMHKIIPIILQETMFLNAYIETLNFGRRVEHGIDEAIEYTVLIRLYHPPPKACPEGGIIKILPSMSYDKANAILNTAYRLGSMLYEVGTGRFLKVVPPPNWVTKFRQRNMRALARARNGITVQLPSVDVIA